MKIRVLLIESENLTRLGIRSILADNAEIEIVAEAETVADGIHLFSQMCVDVTLMSLRFPDSCAVEFIGEFLNIKPDALIIVLAAHGGDAEISRTLELGARGFLLKNVSGEELITAVKTIFAGKKYIPADVAQILFSNANIEKLTNAETKVLNFIVIGDSNKEIAERLNVTENTIKTHVKNILAKLAVDDRTAAATAAIKRGLVRVDF